jgi:hypothetical protein
MKTYLGMEVILELGTRWRRVVSFTPLPPPSRGKEPAVPVIEGWVGSRASLDAVEKGKSLSSITSPPIRTQTKDFSNANIVSDS